MRFFIRVMLIWSYSCLTQAGLEEIFFETPYVQSVVLNPSGTYVAQSRNESGDVTIAILNTQSDVEKILFKASDYSASDVQVQDIYWIDDRYLAVQLTELRDGIASLLHTKLNRKLLILDSQCTACLDSTLSVRTNGWVVDSLPNQPEKLLFAKSGLTSKIYFLNINKLSRDNAQLSKLDPVDGGQFTAENELISVQGVAVKWFFSKGSPLSSLTLREQGLTLVSLSGEEQKEVHLWKNLKEKDKAPTQLVDRIIPLALAGNEYQYFGMDADEDEKRTVYYIDYKTGRYRKIYETSAFRIVSILSNSENEFVGVEVVRNGVLVNEYANSRTIESKKNSEFIVDFDSSSRTHYHIRYQQSHDSPGSYYLVDKKNGEKRVIGREYRKLAEVLPTTQIKKNLLIDGINVNYLINMPTGGLSKKSPLIVMPHGGPIGVFDTPYFDPMTQYLVASGYAVLRVNFRGSGGYSSEFEQAGKKQWGTGMLTDILEVTRKVVSDFHFEVNRVCVVGMSYGGYAAVELLRRYPDTFHCGAAISGVYDLNLHISQKASTPELKKWLAEYIGDPEIEYDALKAISPVYNIENLKRPLIVAHGGRDAVVDMEQSFRLKAALEKQGKSYAWYFDPELGHSFADSKATVKLMEVISEFLNKQLFTEKES